MIRDILVSIYRGKHGQYHISCNTGINCGMVKSLLLELERKNLVENRQVRRNAAAGQGNKLLSVNPKKHHHAEFVLTRKGREAVALIRKMKELLRIGSV